MKIYKISSKWHPAHEEALKNTKYLYHATYEENLDSILKTELDPNYPTKNWESSKNVICLAPTPYLAESYAEISERSELDDMEYLLDQIVILQIDINSLDLNQLNMDSNIKQDEIEEMGDVCFEYHGKIPSSAISVL